MIDNKKNLDSGSSAQYKNKHLEYRNQVAQSKNFQSQLSQAAQNSQVPQAAQVTKAAQMSAQDKLKQSDKTSSEKNEEISSQGISLENTDLPTEQLSPKMTQYSSHIKQAASKYNLPPELIAGVIWQESRGNPQAKSHCGAMGLMQLMPETAAHLGVNNPWDPGQNINGGAKYIRQMLDKFNGKVELAVAAYNAGPGNVMKFGNQIPPFKETQDYVPKVLGYAENFKASGLFIESTTTMRA